MIPEKLLEVLRYEGVVAIATQWDNKSYLVNTWNTYMIVTKRGNIFYPALNWSFLDTHLRCTYGKDYWPLN